MAVWEELLVVQQVLLVVQETQAVAQVGQETTGGTTGSGWGAGGLASAMSNYIVGCTTNYVVLILTLTLAGCTTEQKYNLSVNEQ